MPPYPRFVSSLTDAPDTNLFKVNPSTHSVDDGLWLLEDLLLHEGGEVTLHDLLNFHLEGSDFAVEWTIVRQTAGHAVNGQDTCNDNQNTISVMDRTPAV